HDGPYGHRRGLAQEPERTADDRRLRGQIGQSGPDPVPGVPGLDQREPGGVEPAAAAGLGRRAPDVLSLGGRYGQGSLRRLDGTPAAWGRGSAAGDDVDRAVQRRHPSLWLTFVAAAG